MSSVFQDGVSRGDLQRGRSSVSNELEDYQLYVPLGNLTIANVPFV